MMLEDSKTNEQITLQQLLSQKFTGIQFDSRKVEPGNIFIAITGTATDGHQFINSAIERGAVVIIGERPIKQIPVPYYLTSNARLILALLSSELHDHPWKKHIMIGITGTNGKTTTAYMLRDILESSGISCSLIGTVKHIINGEEIHSNQTTPDPLSLQKLLSMSEDEIVIMEVSSHGLHQDRVSGIKFDFALFTNLSHDHLDYHHNLNDYFEVKTRLFHLLKEDGEAIIGTYNNWGKKLEATIPQRYSHVFTFGSSNQDDLELLEWKNTIENDCTIREYNHEQGLHISVPGLHNIWNALGAYLIARRLGISSHIIKDTLSTFKGVPGRFESYVSELSSTLVVDYAHTPDALRFCLSAAKGQCRKNLVHIFGFRGNRDKSKREMMLEISLQICDTTILTLDDLNNESLENMKNEIKNFMHKYKSDTCLFIEDRTKAIEYAWRHSSKEDLIMITGKGAEKYTQPFTIPCQTDQETILYLLNEGADQQATHLRQQFR